MLEQLTLTPSTIVILAIIVACVVWAIRRLFKKGLCDCHDGCEGCSKSKGAKGKSGCGKCDAADAMVSKMEEALDHRD